MKPIPTPINWILAGLVGAGDAAAANALGVLHADGLAVKRDYRKAAEWYERAAQKGHGEAMFTWASSITGAPTACPPIGGRRPCG